VSLRVRLAAALALVAIATAAAIALTAPTIVGRGFAAMESDGSAIGRGPGAGQGPMAGIHAQQVQRETTLTIIAVAVAAAGVASLVGVVIATRMTRPLSRLEETAASVAAGDLSARSGLDDRSDEIGELARTFDAMAAQLQAEEAMRRRFFQDAAHELRTPLAVIDATTSAVLDGVYEHDTRHLETIREQSRLLSRMVDDLRTISLAEARALPLRREVVPVGPLLASIGRDLEARGTAAGIRIEVGPDPDLSLLGDPDRTRQVLLALTDNAFHHTPSGGWIRLAAIAQPGSVAISVSDSGPGIPAADLPHIFDRFYQADPARDRGSGTSGLGLAIVRALVEAQDGRVSAANEPGAGARIEVVLPRA
jgi:two-component system sensor histidine kinase BaeS